MKTENQIRIGKITAALSFILGSGLFLSYYFSENEKLFLIGDYYIIIAGIINLGVLIWLSSKSTQDTKLKRGLRNAKRLILLNIPIAIIYFFGIMTLLSYMKVTFINSTNSEISNVQIIGCEELRIKTRPPFERTTKWISINGDCYIGIKYNQNGLEKEETVAHYVSGPMGHRYKYRIGIDDGKF